MRSNTVDAVCFQTPDDAVGANHAVPWRRTRRWRDFLQESIDHREQMAGTALALHYCDWFGRSFCISRCATLALEDVAPKWLRAAREPRAPTSDLGDTMNRDTRSSTERESFGIPVWLGLCVFIAIAAFFLVTEHRAHVLGALPYALLLLCPIIHLFMHRGHGGQGVTVVPMMTMLSIDRRKEPRREP